MSTDFSSPDAQWPLPQWTTASLQLEVSARIHAQPTEIFAALTKPEEMCLLFSWMHEVSVDNSNATVPNGLGARRRCAFGNGMVLEEIIVGWEPPWRHAYRGLDETHPFGMVGHLGIIECHPTEGGTSLIWQQYFEHPNPAAMCKQLNASMQMAIQNLQERFSAPSVK